MSFNPSLDITPLSDPLDFRYGPGVFGPQVERRRLDSIRPSLMDPDCQGPEDVYAIAMDVGKKADKPAMLERNLLFGVVTYAKGLLGREPVRSQGHIHAISASCGSSTCEVYEIWNGTAIIYMQQFAEDDPGRCYAIIAHEGDVVIVPPWWAHATIVGDVSKNMTFGAWCVRDYGFDYRGVRAHKGVAFFPVADQQGRIDFIRNENYQDCRLVIRNARDYADFGLEKGVPVYRQFQKDPDRFLFVSRPQLAQELWDNYEP
jgi:glucose-6-phosphate isomerase